MVVVVAAALAIVVQGCSFSGAQRVIMARWGSLGLALQVEGYQRAPTSRNDSLGPALQVEGMREPPTSHFDSLGVVVRG
jgi:hypothetical protein